MSSPHLKKANHFERALDIAVEVNAATTIVAIMRVVMARIAELIPYDRSSVALSSKLGDALRICDIMLSDVGAREGTELGKEVPADESNILGWVYQTRKPHLQSELTEESRFTPQQAGRQVQSHIVVPILGRKDCLGVLTIGSYTSAAFGKDDEAVFATYAQLMGVAIENLRLFEDAQQLAVRDGLTGAFNHRHFIEAADAELNRLHRYGETFSICFIDIDHFKNLNDSYGHQTGDEVLRQTAQILQRGTRASDTVFRYGGEEFVVLLPSTGTTGAAHAANKLLELIRNENICRPRVGIEQQVTVSMGVATAPTDATTREGLLRCADRAMYQAKHSGRDRVVLHSQLVDVRAKRDSVHSMPPPDSVPLAPTSHGRGRTHVRHVAELCDMMAHDAGLTEQALINLRIAAQLHDIGEMAVPNQILSKRGSLTPEERELVEQHPAVGAEFLRESIRLREIVDAVRHHHERFDGNGYPDRLEGKKIPLNARILAIAEVFDALVTSRPYRAAMATEQAYEALHDAAGTQLDPELVASFIRCHRRSHPIE